MNEYAVQYWYHDTDTYSTIVIEAKDYLEAWAKAQKLVLEQPRKSIMALNPVDPNPYIFKG